MRIMENGVCRDATPEEIEARLCAEDMPTEPTVEERLSALEAAMLEQILNG